MSFKNSRVLCFLFSLITITVISSCKSTITETTSLQVINASPDAGPINFYLSGNLKTTKPVTYSNTPAYFSAIAGNQTGTVKSSTSTLLSTPVSLASNVNYSLFVCGLTSSNTVSTILTQDNLITPAPGKAKLRFVHTVVGAPTVSFLTNSAVLFSAIPYKSVSGYTEITAGMYSIKVISADVSAVNLTNPINQTFENGKIYTVYFKGAIGAATDSLKLNLGVINNN